ncbi:MULTISPECIES: hypothetical protein [Stenotrophomonas]|uniref:hypothetical protein n=1 Tax=Stenotrophomonas TaxID=40323 RepID=UPI00066D2CF5|nr:MULTISPECIES: hypothetical protein [Stenotrophomonas]MDQ7289893.1 hypothetical protein [Stenotrophomonas sp. Sm2128]MDT3470804.1 hypothetical protein [Stenotrophomonas maltophilia]MDZ5790469.1 hypothetical protein [Stenotrophomonas maltophilia]QJP18485.1 hypothetical protein HKK60_02695 [Stenotrophomonas maltophilia]UKJ26254.1 hypothetical protein L6173_02675 [Stenotrophomonas maltophilia]
MNLRTHFTQPATFLQRWGFLAIPCAIMIVLLWLPFGFSITGLIEEWDVLALFTLHEPFVWVGPESPLAAHRLRPLTIAPHAIGYMLDRNSFAYWHLLLMGSLLLKGIGASLAGWWLTHSRRWAVVFGLLVVLYPADTMQLSFRSFHINWSIALSLLGVAACAYGYTLRKSRQQTLAMLLAVPCAVLATFAYEAALTFVVVPLLLLYARFGLRGALGLVKRHRWVTAWWILGVAINIGYVLYVKGSGATYQDTLVGPTIDLMDRLQRVIGVGFGRTVLGGWLDAIAICWYEYRTRLYLLLSAVLIGYAVWRSSRPLPQEDGVAEIAATSASVVRMAIIALVMIGLGYLPFAASLPHLLISQRTFLGASPGGALLCVAVLIAMTRRSWGIGVVLTTVALVVAFGAQMFQFEHYRRLSNAQQVLLGDIVENAPPFRPDQTLVIIDKRDQLNDVWMVREGMVMALTYLYDRQIERPVICSPAGGIWQLPNAEGRVGTCEESAEGWTLTEAPMTGTPGEAPPSRLLRRDQAVVVTLEADGTTTSSVPADERVQYKRMLETGHSSLAERYRHILRRQPWPLAFDQFRSHRGGNSFRWDFGRWWSMEEPTRGSGWTGSGWVIDHRLLPIWRSVAWKTLPEATLQFDLLPAPRPYTLTARVLQIFPPATPESIKVRVNDQWLAVHWHDATTLSVDVPAAALRIGTNVIAFDSPVTADPTPLSIQVDWVDLAPAPPTPTK